MKHAYALLAIGVASIIAASPAAARTPAQAFAACLAQSRPADVRELLQAADAQAANRRYQILANDDRCFAQVFGNQPFKPEDGAASMDMLRGRLAEAVLRDDEGRVAALKALPVQQNRYIRPWFAATGRHPAVDEMGACMADTDPAGIAALIETSPGTADENAALSALSPALTKCLSAGTRLDASREALRAALADALYQRLNNPALSLANLAPERGR
jgi:hypothetical protein